MKKIAMTASFLILFSAYVSGNTAPPFPDELLYEGEPIHPWRITATQFGDSCHYCPKPVAPPHLEDLEEALISEGCETLDYDKENNCVMSRICYKYCNREEDYCEGYRYIGTYQGRHVVETSHWDTIATGRFMGLGLVSRVADTIVNAGEITCGDRCHGGIIHAESLKGNILRYQQCCPLNDLMETLTEEPFYQRDISPMGDYCNGIYEANLDTEQSVLWGIKLDPYLFGSAPSALRSNEDCFEQIAYEYVKQGKCILDLADAKHFARMVTTLIKTKKGT